jgi:cytochrome c oxidase subunit IV
MSNADHGSSFDIKGIWKVFFILLAITVVEFIIALAIPTSSMGQSTKNVIYILLTLLKAFYIVAYFMHLKFERIHMIYAIIVPLIFILGIIAALLSESDYWLAIRSFWN